METTKKNIESANVVNNTTAEAMPTAVKGNEVAPSATPPAPKAEKKGKESKAQRKAEELQAEMERKQKELAECLKVLEAKKELSAKRTKFIETLDQIDEAERVLTEDDTFEVSSYRLIFALGASNYNSNDIFKISNRELLLHFVEFIRDKINKKIAEIEAELVK